MEVVPSVTFVVSSDVATTLFSNDLIERMRDRFLMEEVPPLIAGFKIEAFNNDSTTMVIKVNDIYDGTETSINKGLVK